MAVIAVGVVLFQYSGMRGVSTIPIVLMLVGILVTSFGGFWLLAVFLQRHPGFGQGLGPQPPAPPSG